MHTNDTNDTHTHTHTEPGGASPSSLTTFSTSWSILTLTVCVCRCVFVFICLCLCVTSLLLRHKFTVCPNFGLINIRSDRSSARVWEVGDDIGISKLNRRRAWIYELDRSLHLLRKEGDKRGGDGRTEGERRREQKEAITWVCWWRSLIRSEVSAGQQTFWKQTNKNTRKYWTLETMKTRRWHHHQILG